MTSLEESLLHIVQRSEEPEEYDNELEDVYDKESDDENEVDGLNNEQNLPHSNQHDQKESDRLSVSYLLYKYYDAATNGSTTTSLANLNNKTDISPRTAPNTNSSLQILTNPPTPHDPKDESSVATPNLPGTNRETVIVPGGGTVCPICEEDIPTGEIQELPCSHEFCRECLQSYFSVQIESGIVINKCPDPQCGKEVEDEYLQGLLEQTVISKRERFRQSQRQAADPSTRYCPVPTCSQPVSWTGTTDDGTDYKKCSCKCGFSFCAKCSLEWNLHGPSASCRSASRAARQRSRQGHKENRAAEAWKRKNTQGCPRCGVSIQKIHGCDWMLCPQCSNQFCWKCLDPHDHNLATHKHGPHGRSRRVARRVAVGTGVAVAVIVLAIPALLVRDRLR